MTSLNKPIGRSGADEVSAGMRKSRGPTLLTGLLDAGKAGLTQSTHGFEDRQPSDAGRVTPLSAMRSPRAVPGEAKPTAGTRERTILTGIGLEDLRRRKAKSGETTGFTFAGPDDVTVQGNEHVNPDIKEAGKNSVSASEIAETYRQDGVDPDTAADLARTDVMPQLGLKFDEDVVKLIRAIRDLDPQDNDAVRQMRRRIRKDLKGFPSRQHKFHFQLTQRLHGQSARDTVEALTPEGVQNFGRKIDPVNAKLLVAVLKATPGNTRNVLRKINRRFDGLSGGSVAFKQTLGEVLRFKRTGGKRGLSPEAAAKRLMPYVDGRIIEGNKNAVKAAVGIAAGRGIFGLAASTGLRAVNLVDTALTLMGTNEKRDRAFRYIFNGK